MIDERQFCFIICSNNEMYLEECFFYINQLEVPEGYTVDAISIFEAESMANGYNEAMKASSAKYKIYLHQDVFILYKGFLQALLDIFKSDSSIGMVGMVGAPKVPVGGVMWLGHREGMLYGANELQGDYRTYQYKLEDGLHGVDVIDGLMMITCVDIPWREDKFDAWDFYDVSQSLEFRRAGYKVVVPEQLCPWCKHDDGILNLARYDKYRKICMDEYPEYFQPDRFMLGKFNGSNDKKLRVVIVARNQMNAVTSVIESLKAFSDLDESQIIIVDNGSEDGLRHWLLGQQKMDYIICGEAIEGYGAILNEVVKEFIDEENLLLLPTGLMLLPGCIETLCSALEEQGGGAVCARAVLNTSEEGKNFVNAAQYALKHQGEKGMRQVQELPYEAVLIGNEMLKSLDGFEERLLLPESVMLNFASRGVKNGFSYSEIQNAFVYKMFSSGEVYVGMFGRDADVMLLNDN